MKNLLIIATILLAFFSFNSCGRKHSSVDNSDCTKNLIKKYDSMIESMDKVNLIGEPLSDVSVLDLQQNFIWAYKFNVNSIIDTSRLSFSVDSLLNYIDTFNSLNDTFNGVLLEYILMNYPDEPYFTYALSAGYFSNNDSGIYSKGLFIKPNTYSLTHSLVATKQGTLIKIDSALVNKYKHDYLNFVKIQKFPFLDSILVGNLLNHPQKCFFDKQSFMTFYYNNKLGQLPMKLLLMHGAVRTKYHGLAYKLHTPILVFERGGVMALGSGIQSIYNPFFNQAMDVGRLCPPECKKQ